MLSARIAVLASGGGTNLRALLDAQDAGRLQSGRIVLALSDRADAHALERARARGVRAEAVEPRGFPDFAGFERRLLDLLEQERIDVVVLAGFLRILSADFIARYRGRILNVHPSLIPSFCGRGFYGLHVHRAALAAGVKVTGATVHLVDETPDGGPILTQRAVKVLPDDTPETLQRRVMEQAEWRILPEAVERLCRGLRGSVPEPRTREQAPLKLLLGGNRYPGRGIILGCAPDGSAVLAYFIMGRSTASRGRVFERSGDDLVIRLLDPGRVADPSLILYAPLRVCGEHVVVTNGDQTETIREFLSAGGNFEAALRTRSYEPDAPHFTPRVSGLLTFEGGGGFSYRLSILKAGAEGSCLRQFFEYRAVPGLGHLLHTYAGDGTPLPSFGGEPRGVRIGSDLEAFAQGLWAVLDAENRVALYVRRYAAEGSGYEDRLFDRHGTGGEGR